MRFLAMNRHSHDNFLAPCRAAFLLSIRREYNVRRHWPHAFRSKGPPTSEAVMSWSICSRQRTRTVKMKWSLARRMRSLPSAEQEAHRAKQLCVDATRVGCSRTVELTCSFGTNVAKAHPAFGNWTTTPYCGWELILWDILDSAFLGFAKSSSSTGTQPPSSKDALCCHCCATMRFLSRIN